MAKRAKKEEDTVQRVNLTDFKAELNKFSFEVMNEDTSEEDDIPYYIPFKNEALQFITGGICGGKMAEISGDSQVGKSFLAYELISSCQEMGGYALLIDGERATTKAILKRNGVKFDNSFAMSTEQDMTTIFGMMLTFIKTIRVREKEAKIKKITPILIVVDSFPAMQIPLAMEEYEKGKEIKGYAAMQKNAKWSQLIEKFVADLDDNNATMVLINQTQKDRTILFGDNTISKAEDVIKFWATQRIRGSFVKKLVKEVDSFERKTGTKIQVGNKVKWVGVKNRNVAPYQTAYTYTLFDKGMHKYKGFEENLVTTGRVKMSKTKETKDGEKSRKELDLITVVKTGKAFWSVEDALEANPDLRIPIKTGESDNSDYSELDDSGDE